MPDQLPIEVIAARVARIALAEYPKVGRLGPGQVLTVVRNKITGKIYVGLNIGVPKKVSDVLYKAILAQNERIYQGQVVLVRTDPEAFLGGHSEVNALNPAILDRQKVLGRKLTEADLSVFELHNLWLTPSRRAMTVAARCEHCARITRGVAVTTSTFVAEGGVVGELNVPQRGSVIRYGSRPSRPVTTASGSTGKGDAEGGVVGELNVPQRGSVIRSGSRASTPLTTASGSTGEADAEGGIVGELNVPQRGSVIRSGSRASTPATTASGSTGEADVARGGLGGAMAQGIAATAFVIAEPFIKQWIFKTFMEKGWSEEQRAQVTSAIERSTPLFKVLVKSHLEQIQKEKGAGREVKLRIDVDTEWADTSYGPYQMGAHVSYVDLLFEGDPDHKWPLFQPSNFWHNFFRAARVSVRRETFYIEL